MRSGLTAALTNAMVLDSGDEAKCVRPCVRVSGLCACVSLSVCIGMCRAAV